MRMMVMPGLLLNGAIFGSFYAWVCSTMWGLDQLPPEVAIRAMQGMNGSVRNMVFAPAFFGTGPVLVLTGLMLWVRGSRHAALLMVAAGAVYIGGAMLPTLLINVPMNEALAQVDPNRVRLRLRLQGPMRHSARSWRWSEAQGLARRVREEGRKKLRPHRRRGPMTEAGSRCPSAATSLAP